MRKAAPQAPRVLVDAARQQLLRDGLDEISACRAWACAGIAVSPGGVVCKPACANGEREGAHRRLSACTCHTLMSVRMMSGGSGWRFMSWLSTLVTSSCEKSSFMRMHPVTSRPRCRSSTCTPPVDSRLAHYTFALKSKIGCQTPFCAAQSKSSFFDQPSTYWDAR